MSEENGATKQVRLPKYFYRDAQADAAGILETAKEIGTVRDAMVHHLRGRQDKLPQGMTPDAAVDRILGTVNAFQAAYDENRTPEDIRQTLQETIRTMEPRRALVYLASLEIMMRSCDITAVGETVPLPDDLQAQLEDSTDLATEDEIQARIDQLVDTVQGDSLKAFVYAGGAEEIFRLVADQNETTGISISTAQGLHDAMLKQTGKAETYAATVCAVYGMILDGKVPGVTADVDVSVLTALVSAGMTKASILVRLARGEIDAELAKDLLAALAKALKWTLVKALQTALVADVALITGGVALAFSAPPAVVLVAMAIGVGVGISAAVALKEEFEEVVDFVADMLEAGVQLIYHAAGHVFSWAADRLRGLTRRLGGVIPA